MAHADELSRSVIPVVYLEDDSSRRALIVQALANCGYSGCWSSSARSSVLSEHLEEIKPRCPDLLLFGIHPEREESWQNLERVRSVYRGPVLVVSEVFDELVRQRVMKLGGPEYLPWAEAGELGLDLKIETMLAIHHVENVIVDNDHRMQRLFVNILTVMVKILESKDPYTRFHSHSVAMWSRMLGRKRGLSEEELLRMGLAAVFHDFGKIGIPEEILNKPVRLTNEEFSVMMQHPLIARDLLSSIDLLADLLPAITHHHEHWDGSGYPKHLKGEEIPLWARIIGIADAYDTMASRRAYKEPKTPEQVMSEFRRNRGTQFDPQLVDLMLEILEEKHRSGQVFNSSTESSRMAPIDSDIPKQP